MGTTPTYGIYYDDPSMLALGRTQDEKQALSVEAALSTVAAGADAAMSKAEEVEQTTAKTLGEQAQKLEDLTELSLLPVEAKAPGTYTVGTNFKGIMAFAGDSARESLTALGVPLANDSRLLAEVEAPAAGIYVVGSNYRAISATGDTPTSTAHKATATGGGLKAVRVPVTVGFNPQGSPTYAKATVRYLARWNFPIARWRLRVRNIDIRSGTTRAEGAEFTAVYVGRHNGAGGFADTPTRALEAFTLPDGGQEHITAWSEAPLPTSESGEVIFSVGYTLHAGANSTPWPQLGYGYALAGDATQAGTPAGTGFKAVQALPFALTVEVMAPATVPVLAIMGDSLSVGVSSTRSVLDSALSQYAQPRGIIPIHGGSSGDVAYNCRDLTAYKWARWAKGSSVDALLYALGTNDLGGAARTAEQLKTETELILSRVAESITTAIYVQELIPRTDTAWSDAKDAQRTAYNQWLHSLPAGALAIWATSAAVSADGRALDADKDSGDKLHLSTAGYAALASAYRPMTAPAPLFSIPWR